MSGDRLAGTPDRWATGLKREATAAIVAVLASVAFGSALMLVVGRSPASVWWAMITRTASDPYSLGQVLFKASALALTGLSVAIARDAGLFNIGAEGQLSAGALACAALGEALPVDTPGILALPLCLLAAAAAGGLVGLAIGALRAKRDANEVITSIMLNAIVAGIALWIGNRVLFVGGTTTGTPIAPGAELPQLPLRGSAANASLFVALAAVALVLWLRERTTWGIAWRTVGRDPAAARAVGISVARVQIAVMTGAGALAGLAATNEVLGHVHAFQDGLGRGVGIAGISVAMLGRIHPLSVLAAALFLGFLSAGGLTVAGDVPKELIEMLQGVVILAVAAAGPWARRAEAT
jgi:simple sugar transport system permease protein